MDQAARLRVWAATQRSAPDPQVLVVASGKGGVGKTNLTVNLAYALIERGQRVLVLDADLGLANLDLLLGVRPQYHLGHLMHGERTMAELICTAPGGLRLVAGSSGEADLAEPDPAQFERLVAGLAEAGRDTDFLLIDAGAGVGQAVTGFLAAADRLVVVTTPEPTALADAYALLKGIWRAGQRPPIELLINQAESGDEALAAARRLCTTAGEFLGFTPGVLGVVPKDPVVPKAVRQQKPFLHVAPQAPASRAIRLAAARLVPNGGTAQGGAGPEASRPRPAPGPSNFFSRLAKWFRG